VKSFSVGGEGHKHTVSGPKTANSGREAAPSRWIKP